MATALITDDGVAALLSVTAAPTVLPETVRLPLSRKFPVFGENVVLFFSANPATTQLLLFSVLRDTLS